MRERERQNWESQYTVSHKLCDSFIANLKSHAVHVTSYIAPRRICKRSFLTCKYTIEMLLARRTLWHAIPLHTSAALSKSALKLTGVDRVVRNRKNWF